MGKWDDLANGALQLADTDIGRETIKSVANTAAQAAAPVVAGVANVGSAAVGAVGSGAAAVGSAVVGTVSAGAALIGTVAVAAAPFALAGAAAWGVWKLLDD